MSHFRSFPPFKRDVAFIHPRSQIWDKKKKFTRTINLWNWIPYHPGNIDINARRTLRENTEWGNTGCRFCNKQKTAAVKKKEKKKVKWQGQARADTHYLAAISYSSLVHSHRGQNKLLNPAPPKRSQEKKFWILCSMRAREAGVHFICSSAAHSIMKHFIIWQSCEE